ncbi:flavodoxin [Streptomyces sp. NPDC092046]|uniref:flavodoxin n=1 Tax=Streptomyces sp. NPDC092046 TaxID=3366009 RepID=UPI00382F2A36
MTHQQDRTAPLRRRTLLRGALLTGATAITGTHLTSCSAPAAEHSTEPTRQSTATAPDGRGVLLAYFSRRGENYYYGRRTDLATGNTEVLAGTISRLITCEVYRIEAAEPYPDSYDQTVQRNVREQDADARPAIAGRLPSLDRYDTILLGSPIWNVRPPMIMKTFAEALDFHGRTVVPFTTHVMSRLGTVERDYTASCTGATLAQGLAVRGEEVTKAQAEVQAWLRRLGIGPVT